MTIPKKPKKVDDFIAAASVPEANELVTTIKLKANFASRIDAAARKLNLSRNGWIRYAMRFQSLLHWIMGCDRIFTQPFERVEQSMILGNAFLALETSSFQRFSFEINVR